ncbi:MAG TPA: N-acetylglucosamine-specific PTS transporter subunit IIBC [Steroidobacteraceae bacterium]|nr:N-acetylglucosamine-specific PTS transporter subunit IIBC [Steroidobacteraceae bacterium]
MKGLFAVLQLFGRALMLPIAVLPIAGLLLRLGQPDLLDLPAVAAAGQAIFSNLGILFAIGIAVGIARENHGAAALAAVVCFFVATRGAEVLAGVAAGSMTKLSVPAGLLSGCIAGLLYNRYAEIRLPAYLAFFGGRRFVPIVAGVAGLLLAAAFGFGWPSLERGMDGLSRTVLGAGEAGLFVYGVLNRVLIITGLHHVLNNLAWFIVGEYGGVTGDLNRFFAGDPTAGVFMSGFFPVMMFGLPAACLAMYHAAPSGRRRAVGGLLTSMALTSFLTGVTEPIEFTFVFLAPALYALHALLTGTAMVLMDLLQVRLGFGFSAGLFDYVLNYGKATNPLMMLPVGLLYGFLYYVTFRFVIARFGLATPGREPDDSPAMPDRQSTGDGAAFLRALGGAANVRSLDACTTRLRVIVASQAAVDDAALKALGARGLIRPTTDTLQVVVGPVADQLAGDIRRSLRDRSAGARPTADWEALLAALGGSANLRGVEAHATRLLVAIGDDARVDEAALAAAAPRGFARPSRGSVHVIVGPAAAAARDALAHLAARKAPTSRR